MKRLMVGGLLAGLVLVGGGAAYVWFSGGSGEPSTPLAAPLVSTAAIAPTPSSLDLATSTTEAGAGPVTFEILPVESRATFEIGEVLRGKPQQVVGTTDQVAGQVVIDMADAGKSQLGTIVVNARTLTTGNSFRDRAIRGPILGSADDEFEFIEFVPTSLEGLTGSIAIGTTLAFQVGGELTIKGVTKSVTFTVDVSLVAPDRLEGSATADVLRSDFGLQIPSAPGIVGVTDELSLILDFAARPI